MYLVAIHGRILLSVRNKASRSRKVHIMTTATTATTGKANRALVKSYQALVHQGDEGVRAWYRSAIGTSVRDFEATIEEAKKAGEVRGITKNSAKFLPVIVRAFDIKGADKVSVIEICKVAEVAQRALKSDGALALAGLVTDFDDFKEKAELALESKPKKNNTGAGRKGGEVTVKGATADAVIAQALENLQELDALDITDIAKAEQLAGVLKSAIASAKALNAKHPVKAKI